VAIETGSSRVRISAVFASRTLACCIVARGMGSQLKAVGMSRPDRHEHLRVETLGWDDRGIALPG
jgi:hypothetical protein